jgi:hemerythrin superfamily protein
MARPSESGRRGHVTDLFESLSSDHREVEGLFTSFADDQDETTARQICDALTLHSEIEQQVLYPEVRRIVDDGDDLANTAEDEHAAIRALIARIYEAPPPDLTQPIDELRALVERHVRAEETDLFRRLREAGADADALGRRADSVRGEASSRSSGQVG